VLEVLGGLESLGVLVALEGMEVLGRMAKMD
jgi:hypothetical protein